MDFKIEDVFFHFFGLATVLATFSKIWAIFSESSGHPSLESHYHRFSDVNFGLCNLSKLLVSYKDGP